MNDSDGPVRGLIYLTAVDRRKEVMTTPAVDRPNPIRDAILAVAPAVSALLGVVTFLVQYGILTPSQGEALNDAGQLVVSSASPLASIVSALFVAFTGVAASFAVGKVAKTKVTPVEDPRDNHSRPLTAGVAGRVEG